MMTLKIAAARRACRLLIIVAVLTVMGEAPAQEYGVPDTSPIAPMKPLVSKVTAADASGKVKERIKELGLRSDRGTLFPRPVAGVPWNINNLGPVGIGLDLVPPGFTMTISNVEQGSPADRTGKLRVGQVISSINGISLAKTETDCRIVLGDIITEAEATDGKVTLILNNGETVTVQIPVMGRYSKTWPLNCKKSDKIVRGLADLLSKHERPNWGHFIFLLSTGEEKDLAVVKRWVELLKKRHHMPYNWHVGYRGPGLCEYYLRTGDSSILPLIEKLAKQLQGYEYLGGWGGRHRGNFRYGQMNAAGVHCLTFLLMARMCGVNVDNGMLQRSLAKFYRYAGHASVPYGNGLPEGGYRENGKTGALAVAMSAAARLTPEGESSIYARTRDTTAMKSFYATNWFHAAHTGGGIGEIWNHASISLMHEKRPVQYRSYLDTRRWVMDLSRHWNGGIGIAGVTDGYDKAAGSKTGGYIWGNYFALTYTIPRKHLQLYGAPKTKWCKTFKLPVRPWGTPADDAFVSPAPIAEPGSITANELLEEIVQGDSSVPIMNRLAKGGERVYKKYLGHPEFVIRSATMRSAVANNQAAGLVVPLLKSKDPRQRYNGLLAINGMFKGRPLSDGQLTPEMFDLIGAMIENKEESWWVLQGAAQAIRRGGVERVLKHKKRLFELLENNEWWVKMHAHTSLSLIAFHEDHYKEVLPLLVRAYVGYNTGVLQDTCKSRMMRDMKAAPQAVQDYALEVLQKNYSDLPRKLTYSNGYTVASGGVNTRRRYTQLIGVHPKGRAQAMKESRYTTAYARSGDEKDMYEYSGTFTLNKAVAGTWNLQFNGEPGLSLDKLLKLVEAKAKQMPPYYKSKIVRAEGEVGQPGYSLDLLDKGVVRQGGKGRFREHFWSNDMLVGHTDGLARKMVVKRFSGYDFLFLEDAGFIRDDFGKADDMKYSVYLRVPAAGGGFVPKGYNYIGSLKDKVHGKAPDEPGDDIEDDMDLD